MSPLPFKRSYWVIPDKIIAGCYPGGQTPASASVKTRALINAGVTNILSLMETSERNHDGQPFGDYLPLAEEYAIALGRTVKWSRHPIVDGSITTVEKMVKILDTIDEAILRGGTIYIHCWGGRGRTGTVICCWLIRHGLAAPTQAVEKMHALIGDRIQDFIPTPENDRQRLFVEQWCVGK